MKKIIILVLLLSMFLFSLCGCGNLITDFSSYADANSYTTGGGSVSADDINEICVNWVYGSVKIEGSDTDKITFSEVSSLDSGKDSIGEATENKELNESLKMRYKTDGGRLTIQFCKSALRIRAAVVKDLKKDLTIYVPNNREFTEIKADVVSSDIYIAYTGADKIELNSVSADMKLVDCKTDKIKCDTVSGDLNVTTDEALEDIDMNAVSGNLKINAKSIEKLDMDSVSANAELTLEVFDFDLKLSGVSTKLEADGISFEKTSEKNYKFGDGAGNVTFESVSGKVRLEEK
ncbi:MAG: DUF4097 family beta strand repeat protein [Clostridia bacterium]|nr:DUF4097 family beta strand repeat protein [Clostridia bacterium]